MPIVQRAAAAAALVAVLALSGCGGTGTPAGAAAAAPANVTAAQALGTAAITVKATDALTFVPANVTVKAGQIVEFDNPGGMPHDIRFTGASAADLASFAPGSRWQVRFDAAGSYAYQCSFHPGMTGTVTVTA